MDYTKWDTVENWKLTNRGEKEVEAFIRECKAKRKEIMDAGIDTACHTRIPTKALILADINCGEDLAEDGYTGTRPSENESISVYQLLSIADIHILADLVDTIVIARAIIKLLHIKWHKYSK